MRLIVLFVVVVLGCLPARAQGPGSPEALEAAKELSGVLSADMIGQMTDAMTAQVWPKLEAAFRSKKVDPETLAELRAEFEKSLKEFVIERDQGLAGDLCAAFHGPGAARNDRFLSHADRGESAADDAAGDGRIFRHADAADGGVRQGFAKADHGDPAAPRREVIRWLPAWVGQRRA